MECASLKLNENFPMSSLSSTSQVPSHLPLDPWLTAPIVSAATGPCALSGLYMPTTSSASVTATSSSFTGFLAAAGFRGLRSATPSLSGLHPTPSPSPPAVLNDPDNLAAGSVNPHSNSSIVSLRKKAQEHMESLSLPGILSQ